MNSLDLKTKPNFINAEGSAYQIIQNYGLKQPDEIDLEAIAMDKGVLVMDAPLIGAEARLVRKGDKGIIRVSNEIREIGRRRFSIAHELGHWELHPQTTQVDQYSAACVSSYWGSFEEQEANAFAAQLLMPPTMFRPRISGIEPNLKKIGEVAEEYNSTLTSAVLRYIQETEWLCAVVFSEDGIVKWWKTSNPGKREIYFEKNQKIQKYTLAWCYENGKDVSEDGERVEADLWLHEKYAKNYETILEQSIKLGSYKTILTLLWLD